MKTKTIKTYYLSCGNSIMLIALSILGGQCSNPNCPDILYIPNNYFVYKNNSGVDLTLRAYRKDGGTIGNWEIPNEGEIVIRELPGDSSRPFMGLIGERNQSTTVLVTFNNGECLTYDKETEGKNILLSEYYDWNREEHIFIYEDCEYDRFNYRVNWVFTPEDLDNATPCEELIKTKT